MGSFSSISLVKTGSKNAYKIVLFRAPNSLWPDYKFEETFVFPFTKSFSNSQNQYQVVSNLFHTYYGSDDAKLLA